MPLQEWFLKIWRVEDMPMYGESINYPFPYFLITGGLGLAVMVISAPFYVRAIGNGGALPAMFCLAPAILFSCLSSVYRGYYEGMSNMYPTAISEVMEAIFKLLVGLSAAYLVFRLGMGEFTVQEPYGGSKLLQRRLPKVHCCLIRQQPRYLV